MLQKPSLLMSHSSGWVKDDWPHSRSPTSYCAVMSASPMLTMPSPFTSPQGSVVVVDVVDVVVLVVVVLEVVVVVSVVVVVVVVVGRVVVVVEVVVGRVVVVVEVVVVVVVVRVVVVVLEVVVVVVEVVVVVVVGNVPFDSKAPMSQVTMPSWFASSGRGNANVPMQVCPEGQSAFLQHAVVVAVEH